MYGHSKAPNTANICITLHSISSWNSKVRIMGIAYVWAVSILFLITKPFGTWTCMDIVRRQILPTFALPFIAYHHGILRSGSWGSHMYGRYPYSFLIIKPFGTWTCMDIVRGPNTANICITLHSISSWNSKVRIMGIAYVWAVSILFLIIKPFGTWTSGSWTYVRYSFNHKAFRHLGNPTANICITLHSISSWNSKVRIMGIAYVWAVSILFFNHKAFRHLDMYGHSKAPNPANICITLHSISSWNSKVRIMGITYVWAVSILFLIIKPFGTWTCMDIVRGQISQFKMITDVEL
ncbi:hypothetical protein CEXT_528531 [Caerostris extrusa]|uniref:Uncharacterized protein n=1 Tax=Caerostris extrusa TaxID=172846 RepID=A0AAV4V8T1_CAEEX|nr:hypothetical protein CEXT_528531 [Caerostris extrusa]